MPEFPSPDQPKQPARTSRRTILKRIGSVSLATAGIVPFPHISVRAQDALSLSILLGSTGVPNADDFIVNLAQQWGQQNGVNVSIVFVRLRDLPSRVDRAMRWADQRDIVELQMLEPFRYQEQLVDLSPIIAPLESDQGGYADWARRTTQVRGAWFSIPIGTRPIAVTYRPSLVQQAGIADPDKDFPATWERWFALANDLKEITGKGAGQALRQTPFAAPAFCNTYMWGNGGSEIAPESRNIAFDSPEMHTALTTFGAAWQSGFDPDGLTWDDANLITAMSADRIAMTLAGPEAYLQATMTPIPGIADDIAVAPVPTGPAGTFLPLGSRSLGIAARSPNIETATAFLQWWCALAQYSQWMIAHQGALLPPGPALLQSPAFQPDTPLAPFMQILNHGRTPGFSAAPSKASADVAGNYFVVNTFADVARGVDVDTALARGQQLLERFYKR